MARFVDLDEEDDDGGDGSALGHHDARRGFVAGPPVDGLASTADNDIPRVHSIVTEAFNCYP